jgi:hypothetical protein
VSVNLSCGKCKAIRTFSGKPPRCDVCGWFCDTDSRRRLSSPHRKDPVIGKLMVLGGVIAFGVYAANQNWFTPEKDRLAEQYGVTQDKVIIEPKPHGCEFDDAPLGNKHCHYEKTVDAVKACPEPNCRVASVYVSWRKVEE